MQAGLSKGLQIPKFVSKENFLIFWSGTLPVTFEPVMRYHWLDITDWFKARNHIKWLSAHIHTKKKLKKNNLHTLLKKDKVKFRSL